MASLAVNLQEGRTLKESLEHAVRTATAFCKQGTDLRRNVGWCGTSSIIDKPTLADTSVRASPVISLDEALTDSTNARELGNLLAASRITLGNAEWYLPHFMTVSQALGDDLLRLKIEIENYIAARDHKKPFVAAICGEPGSGKSSLAKALAADLKCELVSSNAAQWTSVDQLFWVCERLRTIHVRGKKTALAFIDEVDTKVDGEKLYSKLLAPLWDGAYELNGDERILGLPVVFLIAGSNEVWRTSKSLTGQTYEEDKEPKLADLVSRLTMRAVDLPSLESRREDAIYIAIHRFLRNFPSARRIERNVLQLFAHSTFRFGPRSITAVVDMFGPLQSEESITHKDFRKKLDDLKLHIEDSPFDFRKESLTTEISL